MSENPFELLGLPPSATPEEAVQQAARLCQRAADEATRNRIRQAVRQLTGSDEERSLHALLTHPRPDYDHAARDAFHAAFRRPPPSTAAFSYPPIDLSEVRDILCQILAAELETPALPLEAVPETDEAAEIDRQTAEALWQRLLAEPGG
jgi:hypothetical protein